MKNRKLKLGFISLCNMDDLSINYFFDTHIYPQLYLIKKQKKVYYSQNKNQDYIFRKANDKHNQLECFEMDFSKYKENIDYLGENLIKYDYLRKPFIFHSLNLYISFFYCKDFDNSGKINNDYFYLYFKEGENDKIYRYKLKVSCNIKKLINEKLKNGENFGESQIMIDILKDNEMDLKRYLSNKGLSHKE